MIKSVVYGPASSSIAYTTLASSSTETLRIAFTPAVVLVDGAALSQRSDLNQPGWVFTASNGVLRVRHDSGSNVLIQAGGLSVTLASPVDGMGFPAPASIDMVATASAAGGSIARVEFYNGLTKLGESTSTPYELTWSSVPMGDYSITARAIDGANNAATSGVVRVSVVGPLGRIGVTPATVSLAPGATQQFVAAGADVLGHVVQPQPIFSWSVSGGGTIDATGLFTAGLSPGGPFDVVATSGGIAGTSAVSVASIAGGTLGTTNEGTLTDYLWDNGPWINACRFQAGSTMSVSAVHAKVAAISGRYKCAIYTDSGGSPSALLRGTVEAVNPPAGWSVMSLTTPLVLTNAQYYWLAIWSDSSGAKVDDSGTGGTLRWGQYNYGAWPSTLVTSGGGSFNYCIYATGSTASLTSIAVTPANPAILAGASQQFTATGTYSDGTIQNLSSQVTWTSSATAVATINSSGLATGVSAGTTTITAALAGVSGHTVLTVQATLPAIALTAPVNGAEVTPPRQPSVSRPASPPMATRSRPSSSTTVRPCWAKPPSRPTISPGAASAPACTASRPDWCMTAAALSTRQPPM